MSVSRAAMRRFIDGALTVRVATLSKNGAPLLTPLWFGRDGDTIYIGTRRGSLHARNAMQNPRVVILFGDRGGKPTRRVLRVTSTARVCEYEEMTLVRKARLAYRYFFRPEALAHWAANWRKIGVRNRYYVERTDRSMLEITLEEGEFISQPGASSPSQRS